MLNIRWMKNIFALFLLHESHDNIDNFISPLMSLPVDSASYALGCDVSTRMHKFLCYLWNMIKSSYYAQ